MSDMIERVARAIDPNAWAAIDRGALRAESVPAAREMLFVTARRAIEAFREPTADMIHAAFVEMNRTPSGEWKRMKVDGLSPKDQFVAKMRPRWIAMIDAALKEG